jgi:hypothetical protein
MLPGPETIAKRTNTHCLHPIPHTPYYPPTNACDPPYSSCAPALIFAHVHSLRAEVFPCLGYLLHNLGVCLWYIVEGEDAPAKLEEKVCAEGDEGPEWELQ